MPVNRENTEELMGNFARFYTAYRFYMNHLLNTAPGRAYLAGQNDHSLDGAPNPMPDWNQMSLMLWDQEIHSDTPNEAQAIRNRQARLDQYRSQLEYTNGLGERRQELQQTLNTLSEDLERERRLYLMRRFLELPWARPGLFDRLTGMREDRDTMDRRLAEMRNGWVQDHDAALIQMMRDHLGLNLDLITYTGMDRDMNQTFMNEAGAAMRQAGQGAALSYAGLGNLGRQMELLGRPLEPGLTGTLQAENARWADSAGEFEVNDWTPRQGSFAVTGGGDTVRLEAGAIGAFLPAAARLRDSRLLGYPTLPQAYSFMDGAVPSEIQAMTTAFDQLTAPFRSARYQGPEQDFYDHVYIGGRSLRQVMRSYPEEDPGRRLQRAKCEFMTRLIAGDAVAVTDFDEAGALRIHDFVTNYQLPPGLYPGTGDRRWAENIFRDVRTASGEAVGSIREAENRLSRLPEDSMEIARRHREMEEYADAPASVLYGDAPRIGRRTEVDELNSMVVNGNMIEAIPDLYELSLRAGSLPLERQDTPGGDALRAAGERVYQYVLREQGLDGFAGNAFYNRAGITDPTELIFIDGLRARDYVREHYNIEIPADGRPVPEMEELIHTEIAASILSGKHRVEIARLGLNRNDEIDIGITQLQYNSGVFDGREKWYQTRPSRAAEKFYSKEDPEAADRHERIRALVGGPAAVRLQRTLFEDRRRQETDRVRYGEYGRDGAPANQEEALKSQWAFIAHLALMSANSQVRLTDIAREDRFADEKAAILADINGLRDRMAHGDAGERARAAQELRSIVADAMSTAENMNIMKELQADFGIPYDRNLIPEQSRDLLKDPLNARHIGSFLQLASNAVEAVSSTGLAARSREYERVRDSLRFMNQYRKDVLQEGSVQRISVVPLIRQGIGQLFENHMAMEGRLSNMPDSYVQLAVGENEAGLSHMEELENRMGSTEGTQFMENQQNDADVLLTASFRLAAEAAGLTAPGRSNAWDRTYFEMNNDWRFGDELRTVCLLAGGKLAVQEIGVVTDHLAADTAEFLASVQAHPATSEEGRQFWQKNFDQGQDTLADMAGQLGAGPLPRNEKEARELRNRVNNIMAGWTALRQSRQRLQFVTLAGPAFENMVGELRNLDDILADLLPGMFEDADPNRTLEGTERFDDLREALQRMGTAVQDYRQTRTAQATGPAPQAVAAPPQATGPAPQATGTPPQATGTPPQTTGPVPPDAPGRTESPQQPSRVQTNITRLEEQQRQENMEQNPGRPHTPPAGSPVIPEPVKPAPVKPAPVAPAPITPTPAAPTLKKK